MSLNRAGTLLQQFNFRLPATININKFKEAWKSTVMSVEILRTRIILSEESASLQVVTKSSGLCQIVSSNLESYLEKDLDEEIHYGSPLARYAIVDDSTASEQYFVLTMHHSAYDGWCMPLIMERLRAYYFNEPPMPTTPFRNHIQHLSNIDNDVANEYWREQLEGASPVAWPSKPIHPEGRIEGRLPFSIDLVKKQSSDLTVSTLIRAAWAIIVANYSGSDDIVVGCIQSGRNVAMDGISQVLAPTITVLPVRFQVQGSQSVREFLNAVQNQATSMIPFESSDLKNISRLSPAAEAACDFQNTLVVQPAPSGFGNGRSLNLEQIEYNGNKSFHISPINFDCGPRADGLGVQGIVMYDTRVIDPLQMQRVVSQFEYVLQQLGTESDDITIGDIDLISLEYQGEVSSGSESCESDWIDAITDDYDSASSLDSSSFSSLNQSPRFSYSFGTDSVESMTTTNLYKGIMQRSITGRSRRPHTPTRECRKSAARSHFENKRHSAIMKPSIRSASTSPVLI
jgi:hypothetical protein